MRIVAEPLVSGGRSYVLPRNEERPLERIARGHTDRSVLFAGNAHGLLKGRAFQISKTADVEDSATRLYFARGARADAVGICLHLHHGDDRLPFDEQLELPEILHRAHHTGAGAGAGAGARSRGAKTGLG